jgi:TonB family protein
VVVGTLPSAEEIKMRKTLVVAIALLPTLLHAQAHSPATTQAQIGSSVNATTFEARLTLPVEPGQDAAPASEFDSVASAPVRISTGITPPQILSTVEIQADNDIMWRATGADKTVVVSMLVDKTGKPSNLKITKSAGLELDENVLAAVSGYKFKPGMLNNKPTDVEVNLEIIVHAPGR